MPSGVPGGRLRVMFGGRLGDSNRIPQGDSEEAQYEPKQGKQMTKIDKIVWALALTARLCIVLSFVLDRMDMLQKAAKYMSKITSDHKRLHVEYNFLLSKENNGE